MAQPVSMNLIFIVQQGNAYKYIHKSEKKKRLCNILCPDFWFGKWVTVGMGAGSREDSMGPGSLQSTPATEIQGPRVGEIYLA